MGNCHTIRRRFNTYVQLTEDRAQALQGPACQAARSKSGEDKMKTLKELFEKYAVNDCDSVEMFLDKYYKYDRFRGQGKEYAELLISGRKQDIKENGICIISHFDSVTGNVVSFLG